MANSYKYLTWDELNGRIQKPVIKKRSAAEIARDPFGRQWIVFCRGGWGMFPTWAEALSFALSRHRLERLHVSD